MCTIFRSRMTVAKISLIIAAKNLKLEFGEHVSHKYAKFLNQKCGEYLKHNYGQFPKQM